jgi:hypothetical protein
VLHIHVLSFYESERQKRFMRKNDKKWTHVVVELAQVTLRENTIFWDITPCSQSKVNLRFGGTNRFHLQGRTRYHRESRWQAKWWYIARLIRLWRWRQCNPSKLRLTFSGSHGVLSQNIILFITTAVRRNSCPTALLNIAEWIRNRLTESCSWAGGTHALYSADPKFKS